MPIFDGPDGPRSILMPMGTLRKKLVPVSITPMPGKVQTIGRYRELAPDSAGCLKCDDGMGMETEHHHKDGSVCEIVKRNYGFSGYEKIAPMGRYDPGRDRFAVKSNNKGESAEIV